jgi:hypothetical protein
LGEQSAREFQVLPKMSRYLTHHEKAAGPEEPLERFFSIFEPMRKKMGPSDTIT